MSTIFNISDKIKLQGSEAPSLLNFYGGAAAAYSLRKLDAFYSGDAIRVRRDSDNTEKNIGFVNGELDTASLLDFANEEVLKLQSNYSGATPSPGAATSDLTVSSNQSIAGVNEALKCTVTGTSAPYFYSSGIGAKGNNIRISFDYYIPSGQSLDSIRVGAGTPEQNFTTTGQWATATFEQLQSYTFIIFRANSAAVNDEFYIKNLTITRITSDALVTTWYDQSGNGNNATQATASAQPKIVSVGSTILENGKACVQWNGGTEYLASSFGTAYSQPNTIFVTANKTNHDGYLFDGLNGTQRHAQGNNDWIFAGTTLGVAYPYSVLGSQVLFTANFNSVSTAYINSNQTATGNAGTNALSGFHLGNRNVPLTPLTGNIQELIFYPTDELTNRTNIESNINDFYSIY